MRAAKRFLKELQFTSSFADLARIRIDLYGSLAMTGHGHATDTALILGLLGEQPETVDPEQVPRALARIKEEGAIALLGEHSILFSESTDIVFRKGEFLPGHSNALTFTALNAEGESLKSTTYYSVGGGFVVEEGENEEEAQAKVPYPYSTWKELAHLCQSAEISIPELMWRNEQIWRNDEAIEAGLETLWQVMRASALRGVRTEGVLPGGLGVRRRAPELYRDLTKDARCSLSEGGRVMDWVSVYAMAVNEENAAGGRVVTAPTNGAAGLIPAVMLYYEQLTSKPKENWVANFLLVAAAIGVLYKKGASISAAEVGCQGEVGVACSMAAGALAAVKGGTLTQIENAAEMGMEHNLGLTCDPVGGLVQVPCIERNAMGAVKAINAARLALREPNANLVPLDKVIATMMQTGRDMQAHYKETSQAGLAVNVPAC